MKVYLFFGARVLPAPAVSTINRRHLPLAKYFFCFRVSAYMHAFDALDLQHDLQDLHKDLGHLLLRPSLGYAVVSTITMDYTSSA